VGGGPIRRTIALPGRRLDYRIARKALELIADAVGRGGGQGRPWLWRLRNSGGE
jgi:hypothetical protein